jgi:hypothetical protein
LASVDQSIRLPKAYLGRLPEVFYQSGKQQERMSRIAGKMGLKNSSLPTIKRTIEQGTFLIRKIVVACPFERVEFDRR